MDEEKRILIIEDDQEISKLLSVIVEKAGMTAIPAYSGTEGLLQLQNDRFDLVLLDLMLPGLSGEELIECVKEEKTMPVVVISAKVGIEDKVHMLKSGADDYITKPFNQDEVMARIEVQLRKSNVRSAKRNAWRNLEMNVKKRSAVLENVELRLTNAEFDILLLFLNHPEVAFSKRKIYESIWTGPYVGDDNTISVHVSNLRKKIAEITSEEYIKTIWGVGFMLV